MLDSLGDFSFIMSFLQVPFPEDHQVPWARRTCLSHLLLSLQRYVRSMASVALLWPPWPLGSQGLTLRGTLSHVRPSPPGTLRQARGGTVLRSEFGSGTLQRPFQTLRTALPPTAPSSPFPSLLPFLQPQTWSVERCSLSTSSSLLPRFPHRLCPNKSSACIKCQFPNRINKIKLSLLLRSLAELPLQESFAGVPKA